VSRHGVPEPAQAAQAGGRLLRARDVRDPGVADMAGLAADSLFVPAKGKKAKRPGAAPAQLMAV